MDNCRICGVNCTESAMLRCDVCDYVSCLGCCGITVYEFGVMLLQNRTLLFHCGTCQCYCILDHCDRPSVVNGIPVPFRATEMVLTLAPVEDQISARSVDGVVPQHTERSRQDGQHLAGSDLVVGRYEEIAQHFDDFEGASGADAVRYNMEEYPRNGRVEGHLDNLQADGNVERMDNRAVQSSRIRRQARLRQIVRMLVDIITSEDPPMVRLARRLTRRQRGRARNRGSDHHSYNLRPNVNAVQENNGVERSFRRMNRGIMPHSLSRQLRLRRALRVLADFVNNHLPLPLPRDGNVDGRRHRRRRHHRIGRSRGGGVLWGRSRRASRRNSSSVVRPRIPGVLRRLVNRR